MNERILKYPNLKFEIVGYADSNGSFEFNDKLSLGRVNSVRNYLTQNGVPSQNLIPIGKGELSPIASNSTSEGRSKNRRVEIIRVK